MESFKYYFSSIIDGADPLLGGFMARVFQGQKRFLDRGL